MLQSFSQSAGFHVLTFILSLLQALSVVSSIQLMLTSCPDDGVFTRSGPMVDLQTEIKFPSFIRGRLERVPVCIAVSLLQSFSYLMLQLPSIANPH